MSEVINEFAPSTQDPSYKYYYDIDALVLQMRWFLKKYATEPPATTSADSTEPTKTDATYDWNA